MKEISQKIFKEKSAVTHFMAQVSFYNLWKHQKTIGFVVFSGGIEGDLLQQHSVFFRFLPYVLTDYVRKFPEENETEDKKWAAGRK